MSGTSLDGLDLALCRFSEENGTFQYEVLKTSTLPYPPEWAQRLQQVENGSAAELGFAHAAYGRYLGERSKEFLQDHKADLISSHGHTIFHQPERGFTFQLGSGAGIAAAAGVRTVCDFRTTDVALGGQGAPLVPIGDELLFGSYAACLNIGGIANVSYRENDKRVAYDLCAANMVLNALSRKAGKTYDEDGAMARSGTVDAALLEQLNALPYYKKPFPKSLGKEHVLAEVFPLLQRAEISLENLLRTFTEHAAQQIAKSFEKISGAVLATGGGAHNTFLIERIRALSGAQIVVPDRATVDFKEAIVFAFLGWLRVNGKINSLRSVTGAGRDSVGGCVYE